MNGFNRSFMGQVPLVLGPSSWGVGMMPTGAQSRGCPEGTFLDENGLCRPRVVMGQNVLEYFDVPLGAFPVPWGAGCATGEIRDKNGNCIPDTHRMGQAQQVQQGGVLEYFDVPLGAFPVPWSGGCGTGMVRDGNGECVPDTYGMGQAQIAREGGSLKYFDVPLGAFPVPWNMPCQPGETRDEDGECKSRRMMGQTEKPVCERTAEGGYRCSDGTYLPANCAAGSSEVIKAAPPSSGFPYAPVGLVAAGLVGAGLLLAGRRRMGATALEASFPDASDKLSDYASKINSERAADAYNFQQLVAAGKKRQDLLFVQKAQEAALSEQTRRWESTHMNADTLANAQAAVDQVSSDLGAATQEIQTYRDAIAVNQANIQSYLSNANYVIGSLPPEYQDQGKAIIEPCLKKPGMGQGMRAQPLMSGRF